MTSQVGTEEYNKLIRAFLHRKKDTRGHLTPSRADFALRYSLFTHLNANPDDPKYQQLKLKIASTDFIRTIVEESYDYHLKTFAYMPVIEDKVFLLQLISIRPYALSLGSEKLRDDKDVVMAAIMADGTVLQHASDRLRDNREVVMKAIAKNSTALEFASNNLRDDREVVVAAINQRDHAVKFASDRLKNDKGIAQAIIDAGSPGYGYLSVDIRADKEIMRRMLGRYSTWLEYAIDPDREIVLAAVNKASQPAKIMPYIPYRYASDQEILDAGFNRKIRPANPDLYTKFGKVALVKDDEVRVRDKPNSGGKYVGVLYRNLIVDVLAESKKRQVILGDSHYWYKIKNDELEGWIYGKFISFYVPDKNIDTYTNHYKFFSNEDDSRWFSAHLGNYAAASVTDLTTESITLNQYRMLIECVEALSCNDNARTVLSNTIYTHLKQHHDDPKYAYLKKKLYDPEFLKEMFKNKTIPEHITLEKII